MDSRVPLPTDNVFKFYALFGLFLISFSLGLGVYVTNHTNDIVVDSLIEVEKINGMPEPTREVQVRKAVFERKKEIALSDRNAWSIFEGILLAIGGCCAFYGFRRWHKEIKPVIDETAKIQLEILKLQLQKLQQDVKKSPALPHSHVL